LAVAVDRDLHGAGAVGGRDAGGHALGGLDRDGEGGAQTVPLRAAIGGSLSWRSARA
jgi:hypothetical protein